MVASEKVVKCDVSPAQCRAARGLLDWSMERLETASGVNKRTLLRFEGGDHAARPATIAVLREALEAAGVEFIAENGGGAGVRLRDRTRQTETITSTETDAVG